MRILLSAAILLLLLDARLPAAQLLYEISGSNDLLGWSVAIIGDVTGDGISDVAAGAPAAGPGGEVRVFSGPDGTPVPHLAGVLVGTDADNFLGRAVAPAGDLNGDSIADLLVGASGVAFLNNPPGYAVVLSGATGAELLRMTGADATEFFGNEVAALGDVTGDGVTDYLIGAPGVTGTRAGAVRVFSGADGSPVREHVGQGSSDNFGHGIAALGDVSGDGVADYAIGAPNAGRTPGISARGQLVLVSGAEGRVLKTINGKPGDVLGQSVTAADVNGDGTLEAIASAFGLKGRGGLLAFGGTGRRVFQFVWPFEGRTLFGSALARVPDLTGDGRDEIAVGAEGRHLAAVLASGVPIFAHIGTDDDIVGDALAAGDVTGDGIPELIVGAWGTSIVRVFALDRVTLPPTVTATIDFTDVAATGSRGTAKLQLKGSKVKTTLAKFKFASLPAPGTYTLFLEDAVGSGSFFAVAELTVSASGKAKLTLKAKGGFAPEALGVSSLLELAGRTLELRDGSGTVVLRVVVPALG